jgi:uncharacterized protein (TIGR02147 family)
MINMIFNFDDYRAFLKAFIQSRPRLGRGVLTKMAEHMDMTSAQMSHVFQGHREFNLEQALKAASFLGLSKMETEYFLELVQLARAGSRELVQFQKEKLKVIKAKGLELKNQVVSDHRVLSETEKAIFYSSWIYSAIRLYCSIAPTSFETICEVFQLTKSRALEILNFLCETGLCIKNDDGYSMGQQSTFLPRNSPLIMKHHTNWRLKALDRAEKGIEDELFYTSPVSMSEKDYESFRLRLTALIKEFSSTVKDSKEEQVACLNIDFFKLKS